MTWLDVLSPAGRALVQRHWAGPCADAFEALRRRQPSDVLALCRAGALSSISLGAAARVASSCGDSEAVEATLRPLLDHPSPLVREGAIIGLERNLHDTSPSWERIRRIAAADPVAEVRAAAAIAIEEYAVAAATIEEYGPELG